ncbi:RNA-directed DNA polymerase [Ramlibacter sp. HM2]|uniref:RNA-directed DNA polymerase n=1 Tax=Ramlibacter pallidus TaxID=2780087 RepID=A0ABR9S3C6_9BURK|nr:RNA-directed DNA polymerase [Ramlibacter pallidus]MBE7368020.1 RNA-directed DNA polymerase [Ramlibacter pallidus]
MLHTDIAQFYPSIYTHSVPWVLHTKAIAKAGVNNMALVGNVLDKELQACQLGQTKGVAIGPDTSLGVAELLLSPLDERIKLECDVVGGCRFIDDIELTFRTLADADKALTRIEALLSELELQPNALKTRIEELPVELESKFVSELRRDLPDATNAPPSQWVDYFNRAFSLARADRTTGVLRYAVAALSGVRPTAKAWDAAQRLLWQCVTIDPGSIRYVVDVLAINRLVGLKVPDPLIATAAVDSVIRTSAAAGHSSEVVWSIWAAMYIGFPIGVDSQSAITGMDDALVASAAMMASTTTTAFSQPFDPALWKSWFQKIASSKSTGSLSMRPIGEDGSLPKWQRRRSRKTRVLPFFEARELPSSWITPEPPMFRSVHFLQGAAVAAEEEVPADENVRGGAAV